MALWVGFIPGHSEPDVRLRAPLTHCSLDGWTLVVKQPVSEATSITGFRLLILYYLCHIFPVTEALILLYFLVPFKNLMYCR